MEAATSLIVRVKILEPNALPLNMSAPKVKLIALKYVFKLAKVKQPIFFLDSKYAFGVAHDHGALWMEKGLITAKSSQIEYGEEILQILDAI